SSRRLDKRSLDGEQDQSRSRQCSECVRRQVLSLSCAFQPRLAKAIIRRHNDERFSIVRRLRIAIAMTFSLLLIALGASPAWTAEAQPSDQADSLAAQPITPNWRMLIDQSGRLTLEEVLTQRALFQRLEKRSYTAPASTSAVWLQVSLPAYAQPNWLWVFAPRVQYLDYYQLRDGKLERHVETG